MKAVVTGGNGFIGGWLVKELLDNDYEVFLIARGTQNIPDNVKNNTMCHILVKDINDVIREDFGDNMVFDVFFNLCWDGVSPEEKNNLDKQVGNIYSSIRAMEICNQIGCKKFIASGTVAEYALTTDVMDLDSKQCPNDFYGAAKVAVHYFLTVKSKQIEQPFVWCVLPSTFGERRSTNNIITYTIKSLLKEEKPMYGNLDQMWDFLYVSEVARALRFIGEKGMMGKVYGIGSGEYRPLKDYICSIRDIIDKNLPLGIGERPTESQKSFSSCVNIYNLIKDTGFKPQIGFEEGIKKTIEYYKAQMINNAI